MGKGSTHFANALKHGAYSGTALLPGEDPVAFKKLHGNLNIELAPVGPLEEDIVTTIAKLLWRKQNLSTYRGAEWTKKRHSEIYSEFDPHYDFKLDLLAKDLRTPEEAAANAAAAKEKIRKELGDATIFVEMGDKVTTDYLFNELEVIDRLDALIDRCIKRLLMVRGVKSITPSIPTGSSTSRKRLTAR